MKFERQLRQGFQFVSAGLWQVALLGTSLAVFLAGCVVGPDYHPPKIQSPPDWVSPQTGGETNLPADLAGWWKTFHDTELDSLISRAGQSNLNLRAAVARVREARATVQVVAGAAEPTLDTAGSYTRTRYSANGFPPFPPGVPLDADVYQAGFDAAWELDVFGGTRRAAEAARADVAAAEFDRRDVAVTLFAEVARDYTDARAFQRRLEIAQSNIITAGRVSDLSRDRFNKGLTGDLDVQQAEALLDTARAQTPALENGFRAAAYRLALLLGQSPGAVFDELTNVAPIPSPPPTVPVGLPSDLVQRRPDVSRAERQLAAATARVGQARADLYPKFSLTGDVGLQTISPGDWFTAGSRYWSVGPTVQWRIFDAGRIRANIAVQDARVEQSLAQYEQAMLAAFTDVETALSAYAREQNRRVSLAQAARANDRVISISLDLYSHGLADFLRVLDAQRTYYQSQDALVESDHAVTADLIALYKALGGGWENSK